MASLNPNIGTSDGGYVIAHTSNNNERADSRHHRSNPVDYSTTGLAGRRVAVHNSFRLAIERITAHFVIGHGGDEHGRDRRTVLGGGDLGPEPFADGLPDDPVATSAGRLEGFITNRQ
jgi:hypothetical protein